MDQIVLQDERAKKERIEREREEERVRFEAEQQKHRDDIEDCAKFASEANKNPDSMNLSIKNSQP